jgi:erythromycin esterase
VTPLLDRLTSQGYRHLSAAEREVLQVQIASWDQLLRDHRDAYIRSSSETAYDWSRRDLVAARGIQTALAAWPLDNPSEGVSPDLYKVINIRDAAMAENVRWALGREGRTGRILLFAHNAHIMNATSLGGIWRVYREAPAAMGQHLRAALKDDLFSIATSSAQNEPGFPSMVLAADGVDAALASIMWPRYFVDLRVAHGDEVNHWLYSIHPLSAGFVTEHLIAPRQAYDAFVHFERLTHAHPSSD